MTRKYIEFVEPETLVIREEDFSLEAVGEEEIAGRTLYTMISSGTEINSVYLDVFHRGFPRRSGYTAVFRVEKVGSKVEGFQVGDRAFCTGNHQSCQRVRFREAVRIPENVASEDALFIRMAGVSMATLGKTQIRPGEKAMVTGLGPVGLMAMFVYSNLGYEVIGVDPDENRRQVAHSKGFPVFEKAPFDDPRYAKQIGLALECSGSEAAVLDCCDMVRARGEVSTVGVPWKQYTDLSAHRLLHSVFYNYVNLYSGWELDLPSTSAWNVHDSMTGHYELALRMIDQGKIDVKDLYAVKPYTDAQKAYDDIYGKKERRLATILSWD